MGRLVCRKLFQKLKKLDNQHLKGKMITWSLFQYTDNTDYWNLLMIEDLDNERIEDCKGSIFGFDDMLDKNQIRRPSDTTCGRHHLFDVCNQPNLV